MRTISKVLFPIAVVLLVAWPALGQNTTTVNATITDPNGLPYSNASVQAQLLPNGISPTIPAPCNGQTASPCAVQSFSRATTDVNGNLSMNLASNTVLSPPGTQWQFTVAVQGAQPPLGTGPQSCSATLTITGATQNITSSFSTCPALSHGSGASIPGGTNFNLQCNSGGSLAGIANGITGQNLVALSGTCGIWMSPGIQDGNGGSPVTTSPYLIQCDSSSTILDRTKTIRLQLGASIVTVPLSTAAGCTGGFTFSLINDNAGPVQVNPTTGDTFTVSDGTTTLDAQPNFPLTNGNTVTLNQGATGLWEARLNRGAGNTVNSCIIGGVYQVGSSCYANEQTAVTASNGGSTFVPPTYAGNDFIAGSRIVNLNTPTLSTQIADTNITDTRFGWAQSTFNPAYDAQGFNWIANQWVVNWDQNIGSSLTTGANNAYSNAQQCNYLSGTQNWNQNGYSNKTNLSCIASTLNSWGAAQVNADNFQVNCYGDGDCNGATGGVVDYGGANAGSDEGMHSMSFSGSQGGVEYKGTVSGSPGAGATVITTVSTVQAGNGTQGIRLGPLYDQTTGVLNAGTIANITGSGLATLTGTTTGFPVSTVTTAGAAVTVPSTTTSGAISSTGSVNFAVVSSAGFFTGNIISLNDGSQHNQEFVTITNVPDGTHITAVVSKTHLSGANVAQTTPQTVNVLVGSSAGFTTSSVVCVADGVSFEYVKPSSIPDGTHIAASFLQPHANGFTLATGGMCGYWLSLTDDVWITAGLFGYTTVTPPLRQLIPFVASSSATLATVWISIGGGADSYNGNAAFPTAAYNAYKGAIVTSITNGTGTVSNTFTTEPNTVSWTNGDVVSQAMSPFFKSQVGNGQFTKFFPSQGIASSGWNMTYNGIFNGSDVFLNLIDKSAFTLYTGHGGHLTVPLGGYEFNGLVRYGLYLPVAPDNAGMFIGCAVNSSGTQSCAGNPTVNVIQVANTSSGNDDWEYQQTAEYWRVHWSNSAGTATFGQTNNGIQAPAFTPNAAGSFFLQNAFAVNTAPTIASGFGTGATIPFSNGSKTVRVNVGTGGAASSGVLTMPTLTNNYNCSVGNQTAHNGNRADDTVMTTSTNSSVTVQNQTKSTGAAVAWTASDIIFLNCDGE